jgi:hypothetical protein
MQERSDWGQRIGTIAFGLVLLAVVWWYLTLDWVITATIAGLIVVTGALPPRIGRFAGAGAWFVVAGVLYFHYGLWNLPGLIAIIGVIFLGAAIAQAVRARREGGPEA